jgi:hypothetical protein
MKLYFWSLTWLLLLWISPSCFGQVVRVRVVNGKNGQPLVKQHISISLQYRAGEPQPTKYGPRLSIETDANGVAHVSLPEPAPAHLSVSAHLTSEYWHCVCTTPPSVASKELWQEGILVGGESGSPKAWAKAAPGELLFVARPFTFFERIFYPLYKE